MDSLTPRAPRAIVAETAAFFGPSRTTVTDGVAGCIHTLVLLDGLQTGEVLFHLVNDRRAPLAPSTWTEFVQTTFQTYSSREVALSPKDCRSSFITHLRDGNHGDETLRAAAAQCTIRHRWQRRQRMTSMAVTALWPAQSRLRTPSPPDMLLGDSSLGETRRGRG